MFSVGEGHHALDAELGESLPDQRPRSFGGVSLAPRRSAQPVAQLRLIHRRVLIGTIMEPSEKRSGILLDHCPEAVPLVALVIVEIRRDVVAFHFLARS